MSEAYKPITDKRSIAAGVVLYMLAPVGMSLLPLLVGAAADRFGISEQQGGLLASADLGGICVAAVLVAFWIRKVSWKILATLGIVVLVGANLLSLQVSSFTSLVILRFITELGTGLIYSLAIVVIGDTYKPDRFYAIGVGLTVALSTAFFLIIPQLVEEKGIHVIFLAHAGVALLVLPFLFWMPRQGRDVTQTSGNVGITAMGPLLLAMVAFTFFTAAEGGIWSYLERIGNAAEYDAQFVGQVLAVTQIASVIGSILASVLSTRWGRTLPLIAGIALFIAGSLFLLQANVPGYVIGACLTQFCYIFVIPYFLLMCVELDPTGRFFVLTTAFKLGGMAMGPAIAAYFITDGNLAPVSWVAAVCLVVSLVMIVPLSLRLDNKQVSTSTAV